MLFAGNIHASVENCVFSEVIKYMFLPVDYLGA